MPHSDGPHGGLPHDGVGLGQKIVESRAGFQPVAELARLCAELPVGELLHGGLERVYLGDQRRQLLDLLLGRAPEQLIDKTHFQYRAPKKPGLP